LKAPGNLPIIGIFTGRPIIAFGIEQLERRKVLGELVAEAQGLGWDTKL
jgi:hypothetical protein